MQLHNFSTTVHPSSSPKVDRCQVETQQISIGMSMLLCVQYSHLYCTIAPPSARLPRRISPHAKNQRHQSKTSCRQSQQKRGTENVDTPHFVLSYHYHHEKLVDMSHRLVCRSSVWLSPASCRQPSTFDGRYNYIVLLLPLLLVVVLCEASRHGFAGHHSHHQWCLCSNQQHDHAW